ncbi:hypothetical protein DBR43_11395 [Pedobacter sp. KBW06]|uniref:hypothetical protein n=1 Tax=Pedobacter sp. KBW06 TaxID=2153359 RepID=UPI000F59D874|nr:hypothetical protein [Pedobacter sp. KBW06]RQO71835.1 hypothetical protein DBR43_11395 [Pedobacter sp. KBW06]
MKNLKSYKGICLLALFFFLNVFASKADNADILIQTFKIYPENLAPGGGLSVSDKNASTPFKFHLDLSRPARSTGGYYSGECSFVLVYKDNNNATIDLVSRKVTNADFNDGLGKPTGSAIIPMDAVLPKGILNGMLYIRFTYFNSAQNKVVTEERTNERIQVIYTEKAVPKAPIYMVAGTNNGEYYLSLNDAMSTPAGWSNRGIYYHAYKTQAPGTIPVYEFKGKSYDNDGEPGLPANLTYYSTSNQKPTEALTGSGSAWEAAPSKVAFYAYSTQVPGTIPVYCYSHERMNLFLFIATGEVSDLLVKKHIAFYAFPAQ